MNKISNILKKLGLKHTNTIVTELTTGGQLSYYYELYNNFKNMTGGKKAVKEIIHYKNNVFVFYRYKVGNAVHYALHPEENIDKLPECSLIIINKIKKSATIHGIVYYEDLKCFTDAQVNTIGSEIGGKLLLKLSLAIINKVKDHYNLKYIQLTDNSRKKCDLINEFIDLDSLKMLTSGNTWYGSYGFIPFNSTSEKTDKMSYKDYLHNQKIVKNTLVKNANIEKYVMKAIDKYKLKINKNDMKTVIKKYDNTSVMKCLKDLTDKYDKHCAIFHYLYNKLMSDLNMKNLHGRVYWKQL